jgi:regulator of protease activity HflC (stomatin/prohibitin superfamily)
LLFVLVLLFALAVMVLSNSLRIVPQQRSWVVERLGKYNRCLEPGLNVLAPFIDRVAYRFDMREVPLEVPKQVCISLDNTTLTVDGYLFLQITDAYKAAYGSTNPMQAAMQLAQTSMRSEIGKLHLDQALSSRQELNAAVGHAVDEAATNWGVKVLRYEIKDITPPEEILRAMELQITAEREKRATIARSEGTRQQQINTSEGKKQEEINLADGRKQAEILRAQGEAQAINLVAQATSEAIRRIGEATSTAGGIEALQMQLAKEFIAQWGNLAKAGTTLIIPAQLADIGALVAGAMEIVRKVGPTAPPSGDAPNPNPRGPIRASVPSAG